MKSYLKLVSYSFKFILTMKSIMFLRIYISSESLIVSSLYSVSGMPRYSNIFLYKSKDDALSISITKSLYDISFKTLLSLSNTWYLLSILFFISLAIANISISSLVYGVSLSYGYSSISSLLS